MSDFAHPAPHSWPMIRHVGLCGMLVSFGDRLSEPANRAALAFRAVVDAENWDGIEETSTSLTSSFLRFDPLRLSHSTLQQNLETLLHGTDWYAAPPPGGRRFWQIPTVYGTDLAPQFAEAAALAGMSEADATKALSEARVRVLTLGFAAGQPYLGELPKAWNIARQTNLTASVPAGALVVAIRQFVLFTAPTPTGWRHVGQTAFRAFRPDGPEPFALRAGDEVQFPAVTPEEFLDIERNDSSGNGGAVARPIK